MLTFIRYRLERWLNKDKLGSAVWYPMPVWLRIKLAPYPMWKQVLTYARLNVGVRIHDNTVPQELACANTITGILETVDSTFFGGGNTVDRINGTYSMSDELTRNPRFARRYGKPQPGDILLNPTGKGYPGRIGHVGIVDYYGYVLSNDSPTGKLKRGYTVDEWYLYFEKYCGIPTEIYQIIK